MLSRHKVIPLIVLAVGVAWALPAAAVEITHPPPPPPPPPGRPPPPPPPTPHPPPPARCATPLPANRWRALL